jgi:hypothetical protein
MCQLANMLIKIQNTQMFTTYFKIAIRCIGKNKAFSAIKYDQILYQNRYS